MDAEDKRRTLSNKAKLLAALKLRGALTNHQCREIGGSRALGRIHELIHDDGEPITVRKLTGGTWEVRYQQPALARSAQTPVKEPDGDWGPLSRTSEENGAFRS